MKTERTAILVILIGLATFTFLFRRPIFRIAAAVILTVKGKKTVADRVEEFDSIVAKRLKPEFERIGIAYPPQKLILIGLKTEKQLEVWVQDKDGDTHWLKTYPILKTSGTIGPKLKEGDYQVPEGLYRIESLNPNSRFHLSLRIDYPNAFDRKMAKQDGRIDLGSDIMIHGSRVSIGCLAMGDPAAEDLFVLVAQTGIDNVSVILSPVDFRTRGIEEDLSNLPDWTPQLYEQIKTELIKYSKSN